MRFLIPTDIEKTKHLELYIEKLELFKTNLPRLTKLYDNTVTRFKRRMHRTTFVK